MLFHWSHLRLDFYCFLHPLPFLLGETPQDNFWLSCPTVPEIGGRAESLNGQQTSREERCHFPFWHQGRLRYECVELDTTSSSSSSQVFPCFSSMILTYVCYFSYSNCKFSHKSSKLWFETISIFRQVHIGAQHKLSLEYHLQLIWR